MSRTRRPRLTYANVVTTICVFLLLGGGAYAAHKLRVPKSSVGTRQLRKNAVTSPKVKDHSLTAADVKPGQFATPADVAGLLHGKGHVISAKFRGATRAKSPFVTAPGGLSLTLACDSSGWSLGISRTAAAGSRTFDVIQSSAVDNANPFVQYAAFTPSSPSPPPVFQKDTGSVLFDISSDAGYVQTRWFLSYDNTTNECLVSARGFARP